MNKNLPRGKIQLQNCSLLEFILLIWWK